MEDVTLYNGTSEVVNITAVGDFNTEAAEIFNKLWNFSITSPAVDGTPTYTVQCSNDLTTWYDYLSEFKDIAYDNSISETSIKFEYRYFRVAWKSTGVTTGTITFILLTDG